MNDRRNRQPKDVLSFGPFSLFAAERLLKKGDEPIPLGGRALDILIALAERAGEVVTHKELISTVWPDVTVEEANLRFQMAALRKALGDGRDGARYISNIAGRGYCFVAPVTRSGAEQLVPVTGIATSDRVQKLPPRLARMVGRDDTVRALAQQLQMWRFVSIVGPGGVGKTTVAISVAHALVDGFHGAVFFIDLAALTDPQLVPTAVASALGFMVQTQDPLVSLLAFIGDRKILLVLDNCEHVIDVAAALAERVVSETPQAHVLATSREALRVEGEHVHLLYSLDCPPEDAGLTATEALRYPAAQLFMERAAASGYGAALSDIDAPIVARICRRLDGIALAIELAASRVGSLGIRGVAELLDNRFSLLWHGRRTALPRHETLNAMLDWSYNLLSEREKVVLCRLSVFVGGFTLQAAGSVASETEADEADVIDAVASLVAKSLISTTVINESTYYRLLDTTRAYAAAKLAERGETDRIARRHAIFYSKFLEHDEIIQSLFGEHDLSGYAPHIGNVRAALEWALSDHGDVAVGVELATWAAPLFIGLSLLEECRGWCERALAALDDASRGTRQEMILQEALALSSMFTRGHSDQVRAAIERGLALAETFQDRAAPTAPSLRSEHFSSRGSATSAAPWRSRNRAASSRRLPSTRPAPSGRSVGWAMLTTFWATKPRHNSILSAAWHSRSSLVRSAPTSSVLISASTRSSASPAPCGCVASPIRRLESCKRPSMKRRAEITQFRSAFRWFMPRCCYCGPVICQEPATSSSS